jgi:hypothetical protein
MRTMVPLPPGSGAAWKLQPSTKESASNTAAATQATVGEINTLDMSGNDFLSFNDNVECRRFC